MADGLPTADDVLADIEKLIERLGIDAFRTEGRVQLYSGPRQAIRLLLKISENRDRAIAQAKRLDLTTIDDTEIGRYVGGYEGFDSLYGYFGQHYGKDSREAVRHADRVLRETSRAFMRAAFGQVATAVCAAATDRIFFEIELPEMVENHGIQTINGLPADLVRDFYRIDPYEAFRLICIAELIEARRYARATKRTDVRETAERDYIERLRSFLSERHATRAAATIAPEERMAVKMNKRRVLARYRLLHEMAAITDAEPMPVAVAPPSRRSLPNSVHAAMPLGTV